MVNFLELHLAPPQVVVMMQARQVLATGGNQIVVNRLRHLVGKECRRQGTFIAASPSVVDVALHRAGERGRQSVLVRGELLIVLPEGGFAHGALRRMQQRRKRGVAQFDQLAGVILDRAEFQIGVVQLAKHLVGRQ